MSRSVFFFVLLLFSYSLLKAQDSLLTNLPAQWRLEDCIAYAKQNNISLASLRLSTKLAEEDLLQAKAGILPNLTGSVSQSLVNNNTSNTAVGGSKANFSSNYGLNSSITLYNGGYLKNDIRAKQFLLQSANLSLQETENSLTLSITQAFFNILLAREIMVSLEAVLTTSTGQLKQGQQRFDAGALARKDLLLLDAQTATDRYNLVNATSNFKLNTVIVKQFLLLPSSYQFIASAPAVIPVQQNATQLSEAQDIAIQTRPEIKNKNILIQLSETELEKTKAAIKPIVSAGAALSTGYSGNQGDFYLNQIGNNFYQSLGVTMGIPIYSRRVNRSNINRANIFLKQAKLNLYDSKTILNQQVEQIYLNLQNAEAQFISAEIQLKTYEEIYRISNEQLLLGGLNTVELLVQKNAYIQSLQLFTQAKYRVALYHTIYTFYMGTPVQF